VEDDEEATGATRDEATVDYSLRLNTLGADNTEVDRSEVASGDPTDARNDILGCFGRSDRRAQEHRLGCLETKNNGDPSTRHRHDGRCSRSPLL
jgi:hypothetical protein